MHILRHGLLARKSPLKHLVAFTHRVCFQLMQDHRRVRRNKITLFVLIFEFKWIVACFVTAVHWVNLLDDLIVIFIWVQLPSRRMGLTHGIAQI